MAHRTWETTKEPVRRRLVRTVPKVETHAMARLDMGSDLSSQAAALQRLGDAQRATLMRDIAHVQGNQHVQRLVEGLPARGWWADGAGADVGERAWG